MQFGLSIYLPIGGGPGCQAICFRRPVDKVFVQWKMTKFGESGDVDDAVGRPFDHGVCYRSI